MVLPHPVAAPAHPGAPALAVMCVHPAFRSGELSATGDPSAAYSGGEGEMLAFLKANPQIAAKAGAVAVKFAQENPDVARAALAGSAGATAPKAGGGAGAGGAAPSAAAVEPAGENPWA